MAATLGTTKKQAKPVKPKLRLQPGHFYRARNGDVWCCYRVRRRCKHYAVDCINVETSIVEYFFKDGRYDIEGKREHTLIEEVDAP